MNPPNKPNMMKTGNENMVNIGKQQMNPTIAPYTKAYFVEFTVENPETAEPSIIPNIPINPIDVIPAIIINITATTTPFKIGPNSKLLAISSDIISPLFYYFGKKFIILLKIITILVIDIWDNY